MDIRPGTTPRPHLISSRRATLFGKAAALLFSVCQNHTLLDGNKRLAWAAAVTFLALNGHPIPHIDVDAAEAFMISVASSKLADVAEIERAST